MSTSRFLRFQPNLLILSNIEAARPPSVFNSSASPPLLSPPVPRNCSFRSNTPQPPSTGTKNRHFFALFHVVLEFRSSLDTCLGTRPVTRPDPFPPPRLFVCRSATIFEPGAPWKRVRDSTAQRQRGVARAVDIWGREGVRGIRRRCIAGATRNCGVPLGRVSKIQDCCCSDQLLLYCCKRSEAVVVLGRGYHINGKYLDYF